MMISQFKQFKFQYLCLEINIQHFMETWLIVKTKNIFGKIEHVPSFDNMTLVSPLAFFVMSKLI
jgi:hypothetical protein